MIQIIQNLEGLEEALNRLTSVKSTLSVNVGRALFRIGGLWKKTAVDYSPISPSTSMMRRFARRQQTAKRFGISRDIANTMNVVGRKGQPIRSVTLTKFYDERLNMLLSNDPKSVAMPGGLMRSIAFRSDESKVECFVPSNSPGGKYAFKIHEEKGSTWKNRGPGTQAKGPQADDKFITRAAADKEGEFVRIINSEIDKALGGK